MTCRRPRRSGDHSVLDHWRAMHTLDGFWSIPGCVGVCMHSGRDEDFFRSSDRSCPAVHRVLDLSYCPWDLVKVVDDDSVCHASDIFTTEHKLEVCEPPMMLAHDSGHNQLMYACVLHLFDDAVHCVSAVVAIRSQTASKKSRNRTFC